jgi:hypothetical protein
MAAKKKQAAGKKPAPKPKGKAASAKPRIALQVLSRLPPLDERRRRVYTAAFSDEQCDAWGARTKAENVRGEAERFIGVLDAGLKKGTVTGYSQHRLAWLAHLVGELDDAIARDNSEGNDAARTGRSAAVTVADRARRKLVNGLRSAATGNDALIKDITDRNESSQTPHVLESTLTGLLQIALRVRRSDDGALLADDAGITEAFLSSVSAITEALRASNEQTYVVGTGNDSSATNRVEGRVLREMGFALAAFQRAKADGEAVPDLRAGPQLAGLISRAEPKDEAPAEPAKVDG